MFDVLYLRYCKVLDFSAGNQISEAVFTEFLYIDFRQYPNFQQKKFFLVPQFSAGYEFSANKKKRIAENSRQPKQNLFIIIAFGYP